MDNLCMECGLPCKEKFCSDECAWIYAGRQNLRAFEAGLKMLLDDSPELKDADIE
jgi:hypothetical protein